MTASILAAIDPVKVEVVVQRAAEAHRRQRRQAERHYNVNFVRLLELVETPPTRALNDDGTRDSQPHVGVRVQHQLPRRDQVEEVAGRSREVAKRHRVFLDRDTLARQPLRYAHQLVRIEQYLPQMEAVAPF